VGLLAVLKARRVGDVSSLAPIDALFSVLGPVDAGGWIQLIGIAAFTLCGGMLTAAVAAARRRTEP